MIKHAVRYGLVLLLLGMLASPQWAMGGVDARMQIRVVPPHGQAVAQADIKGLEKNALPALWNRLIPVQSRAEVDGLRVSSKWLSRVIPGDQDVLLEFNQQKIFQTLHDAGIDYILTPPRFSLLIHVMNQDGLAMPESEALLVQSAQEIASRRGIELRHDAPTLILTWRWMDQDQLMLTVRGHSNIQEFSANKSIIGEDPLPVMQLWLEDVLLSIRDDESNRSMPVSSPDDMAQLPKQMWWLELDRAMDLPAQAALEAALRHDPRVKAMIPYRYSATQARYRMILAGGNAAWLPDWLAQRGFSVTPMSDFSGWTAR